MYFTYHCLDKDGRVRDGRIEARSISEARKKLDKKSWKILFVKGSDEEPGSQRPAETFADNDSVDEVVFFRGDGTVPQKPDSDKKRFLAHRWLQRWRHEERFSRVPVERITRFYREVAVLIGAGVSLDEAVSFSSGDPYDPLSPVAEELSRLLIAGHSLSNAMQRTPGVFQNVDIALIRAGEETGRLDKTFDHLADLSERNLKLVRMVTSALTYPAVLAVTMATVSILFVVLVVGDDQGLFGGLGMELPWPTQVLVAFSNMVTSGWGVFILVCAAACVLAFSRQVQRSLPLKRQIHYWALQIPALGHLIREAMVTRLLYVLSTCLRNGLPLLRSLDLARGVTGNLHLSRRLHDVCGEVRTGQPLGDSLQQTGLFSPMVFNMVTVGEESGQLDHLLMKVAMVLEEDLERVVTGFARLIEPLLLGAGGVVAGFVALAALLPILNFMQSL